MLYIETCPEDLLLIFIVLGLFLETPVDYFDDLYWPFLFVFWTCKYMLNVIFGWRLQEGGNFLSSSLIDILE